MNLDFINSMFSYMSSLVLAGNIYETYKLKIIKGITLIHLLFFTSWSLFYIYYFFQLNQTLSFISSCFSFLINLIWLGQYFYYKRS